MHRLIFWIGLLSISGWVVISKGGWLCGDNRFWFGFKKRGTIVQCKNNTVYASIMSTTSLGTKIEVLVQE